MGWKQINGKAYYYRSKRIDGRPVTRYVGAGPVAPLIAQAALASRVLRDMERARAGEAIREMRAGEEAAAGWFGRGEVFAAGVMLGAGCYRHRGQWRRMAMGKVKAIEAESRQAVGVDDFDVFRGLVDLAHKGDKGALSAIRASLKSPGREGWAAWFREAMGNPADWLQRTLPDVPDKGSLAIHEASLMKLDHLRAELAGPDPSPIERVLAERAAHCWYVVNCYETLYLQAKAEPLPVAEFAIRRINSAHRRFLSAVATLARVRKLALPSLQVNVVGQAQVNVGGKPDGPRGGT